MADIVLIASTLIMVETTLYAVALALYTLLVQRGKLSFWDRLLIELFGQPAVEEVTSKVVDIVFRRAYVAVVSVNFLIGLLGGFWSMATDDLTWALVGVAFFAPAFVSFLVVVEVWIPYATKRVARELQESKRKRWSVVRRARNVATRKVDMEAQGRGL